ncbi:hypothetical protein [Sulfuricurvum sp.]|uniref:hypothetical protein n=1 Tax=Sulfuricurvum sp. TaxID=2025608 RepID=UPI003565B9E2
MTEEENKIQEEYGIDNLRPIPEDDVYKALIRSEVELKEVVDAEIEHQLEILEAARDEAKARWESAQKENERGVLSEKEFQKELERRIAADKEYEDEVIRSFGKCRIERFVAVIQRLRIVNKKGKKQEIKLNTGQRKMLQAAWDQATLDRPIAVMLLKARQFGGSTFIALLFYLFQRAMPGRLQFIIAHKTQFSKKIHQKLKVAYENDPNKSEMKILKSSIEDKEDGEINVESGYDDDLLKSTTTHGLHASEIELWRDPEGAFLAMLQAVPEEPLSMLWIETTAKGQGTYFHKRYTSDIRDGISRIFVGWHEIEEYTMPFVYDKIAGALDDITRDDFIKELKDEEHTLMRAYNLTLEQMHWRRYIINKKCNGSDTQFKQEYPINEREAFLGKGHNVFDGVIQEELNNNHNLLMEKLKEFKRPWIGEITIVNQLDNGSYEHRMRRNSDGRFTMFEMPQKGHSYVIGVDVSEGIEIEGVDDDEKYSRDNHAITVIDVGAIFARSWHLPVLLGCQDRVLSPYQVASWYGKCEPTDLAYIIHVIAEMYFKAFTAIEANNHGISVIKKLHKDLKYPSSRMMNSQTFNVTRTRGTNKLGWMTTSKTRGPLIDNFCEAVNLGYCSFYSKEFIKEVSTFIDIKGKFQAARGCRDDALMSAAIAVQAYRDPKMVKSAFSDLQGKDSIEARLNDLKNMRQLRIGQSYKGMTVVK